MLGPSFFLNPEPDKETAMDTSKLMPAAVALALLYGVSRFVDNPMIKAATLGAMGVIVAKQIPYVQDALA